MKNLKAKLAVMTVAGAPLLSFAATDFSPIKTAIEEAAIGDGVMLVAGALALVYATVKGVKIVSGFLRGA